MTVKSLFIWLSALSRIGDRMWTFAAYLLLTHAFPDNKILLAGIYGVSNALSTALLASWVGGWIDRRERLHAAQTLLVIQNLSVAIAASIQILAMDWPFSDILPVNETVEYWLVGAVTFWSCVAMLAGIGYGICVERDWVPQVFVGDDLTSVNAWVRRIDQGAMLLGPVFASLAIDASPKIGGCLIAGWNVCSLILEIYLMRKIYFLIPALRESRERKKSEKPFRGIRDWASSWKLWLKSPVFWPGLALAVLYTNIFQLSFLAQGYASSHCINAKFIAAIWVIAGVCGFSATWFYEYFIKTMGLVNCAILGAVLHFSFVLGTIGGLFIEGSLYQMEALSETAEVCLDQLNSTAWLDAQMTGSMPNITDGDFIKSFDSPCIPTDSTQSILVMLFCCALSRCGLWIFDLAVNQMFQEWVSAEQRGRVSGAQNGAQYFFDCVHFGLIFVWTEPCEYGHGIILTAFLMFIAYSNFILRASCTNEFENLPREPKITEDGRMDQLLMHENEKNY